MTANSTGSPVWLVTGSSAGLGRQLCEEILKRGDRLIATARRIDAIADLAERAPSQAKVFELDVTNQPSVALVVEKAIRAFGRIDILVNNAAIGSGGAVEENSPEEIRRVFDTNIFGMIWVTQAILPHLRKRRAGRIVNISSIGGFRGRAGVGIYNASKFAVEGLSEALADELAPLGISVHVIDPGGMASDFRSRSIQHAARQIEDYAGNVGAVRATMRQPYPADWAHPSRTARFIVDVMQRDELPFHLWATKASVASVRQKLVSVEQNLAEVESLAAGQES